MKITLVRHGDTEWNLNNKIQGLSNIELCDTGRRKLKKIKFDIRNNEYDFCYMSPLLRTVESAIILVGDRVETIPDKRLIERDMGQLEGLDKSKYDRKKYWDYELNCNENGVEPVKDIFDRCDDFLKYIKDKYDDNSSILIISHGAIIKSMHIILNNIDRNSDIYKIDIPNCFIEEIIL